MDRSHRWFLLPTAAAVLCAVCLSGSLSASIIFSDTFSYPDGGLVANSGGNWTNHSGTPGQVDVLSGKVNLTQAESEDVNRTFTPLAGGSAYAGFDVNFSALPTGTGGYFAHFKDSTTSGFRGRVFATTTGAAAGMYRLGVGVAGSTFNTIPVDLALGTTYRAILEIDTATMASILYLNGCTDGVSAPDSGSVLTLSSFALRQSTATGNGMGVLTFDNLIVAKTCAEALPEPMGLAMLAMSGGVLLVLRRRAGFHHAL
jgi:hypothetical protein